MATIKEKYIGMKKVLLFIIENIYYGFILFFILLFLAQFSKGILSMNFGSPYLYTILWLGAICLITKWLIYNFRKDV